MFCVYGVCVFVCTGFVCLCVRGLCVLCVRGLCVCVYADTPSIHTQLEQKSYVRAGCVCFSREGSSKTAFCPQPAPSSLTFFEHTQLHSPEMMYIRRPCSACSGRSVARAKRERPPLGPGPPGDTKILKFPSSFDFGHPSRAKIHTHFESSQSSK